MSFPYVSIYILFENEVCSYTNLPVKYVPSWFPGAGWKHFAHECRMLACRLLNKPFDEAMAKIVSKQLQCLLVISNVKFLDISVDRPKERYWCH